MSSLIIHLITSLEGGGTENFLDQMLAHSPAAFRHKVLFLKKDGVIGNRIRSRGIPVIHVANPFVLRKMLLDEPPVVLHTCLFWGNQMGRCVGRWANLATIVSSQRAIDTWQKPWHRLLDHLTLPLSHAVIANSIAAQTVMEQRRGRRKKPVLFRLYNGVDNKQFVRQDRWIARQTYGLPLDALVGGTLMRLHSEKGADRIPAYAASLLKARPDLHLLVGGVGPLEKTLKAKTAGHSWSNRLHWTGWENSTPQFLTALDFFWSLSREESFPQALLEASVMEVPWLAPDVGGTKELISNGASGLLYPPSSPEGSVHAAFELIRLLNEFKSKAAAVAPTLRALFSIDRTAENFYKILLSINSKPSSVKSV